MVIKGCAVMPDPLSFYRATRKPIELHPTPDDVDGDGISNAREVELGTRPDLPDTDGDGLLDGIEVAAIIGTSTDPLKADTDGDGFTDWEEDAMDSNPRNANDRPQIPDVDISVATHEIGHLLWLPDLYKTEYGDRSEPYDFWDIMAHDSLQFFSAFSCLEAGWVAGGGRGLKTLEVGSTGLGPTTVHLVPTAPVSYTHLTLPTILRV